MCVFNGKLVAEEFYLLFHDSCVACMFLSVYVLRVLCVYGPSAWNKTDDDDDISEMVRDTDKVTINH